MKFRFLRVSIVSGLMVLLVCRALRAQTAATIPSTAPSDDPAGVNDPHSAHLLPNVANNPDSPEVQQLRRYYNALQNQLDDLLATKGAQHPDVLRVQRQLARVEQALRDLGAIPSPATDRVGVNGTHGAESPGNSVATPPDSPEVQQLRSYLRALHIQFDDLLATKGAQHPDVLRVQRQIARIEQELRNLGAMPAPSTAPTTQLVPAEPDLEKWVVTPSLVSEDPFQYRLLPDLIEQTPGNAVPLYLMTQRFWPNEETADRLLYPANHDYIDTPIDQFPKSDAQKLLRGYADALKLFDQAARRNSVYDWPDSPLFPATFVYHDDLRHATNLLAFRVRFQASQNDWDAASYSLRTLFSMAHQCGSLPYVFTGSIAAGQVRVACARGAGIWIQHPNSPNLYWALSNLPHPFLEVSGRSQYERISVGQTPLDRAGRGEDPAASWTEVIGEMFVRLVERSPGLAQDPLAMSDAIDSANLRARQYLLTTGIPAAKVEAMERDEAVGRYWCVEFRRASDQLWKCWGLPFPEARKQMLLAWQALRPKQSPLYDNPLFKAEAMDLRFPRNPQDPYVDRPMILRWRYEIVDADRQIAFYQTIEALRDYAARHGGQPPEHLADITELPVPPDPITGEAFEYTAHGQTATLSALIPWWVRNGWVVELTFSK